MLLQYSSIITAFAIFHKCPDVQRVPSYLVPLLQLMVGELCVLPEVLQHFWPQLAVLLPHVSGTGLLVSFTTTVTVEREPGRLSHLPVRDKNTGGQQQ